MFVKFTRSNGNGTLEPIWINSNNVFSIEDASSAAKYQYHDWSGETEVSREWKHMTMISTGGSTADGLPAVIVDGSVDETLAKLI